MKKLLQILGRIMLGLLLLLALIAAGLAAYIAYDASTAPKAATFTNVEFPAADGSGLRGYLARPSTPGPHPALIMIHEFYGLNGDITQKADTLAQEGYVVLAPDVYRNQSTASVPRAIYLVSTIPKQQIFADLDAAYRWLLTQPDVDGRRTATMGFCFGGGQSLQLGLRQPQLVATVVFYGQLVTEPAGLTNLRGPVLGIFGERDGAPSPTQAKAFQDALNTRGIKNEISIYPGVGHAFLNSENIKQPGPAGDAWQQLLRFLDANVKRPGAR